MSINTTSVNEITEDVSHIVSKVIELQNKIQFDSLLATVNQWDSKGVTNQYKAIKNFECFVCSFKTNVFDKWKSHIMSVPHMMDCSKTKNLFSYICGAKRCKSLFYGPFNCLCKHQNDKHLNNRFMVSSISILMSAVMKRKLKESTTKQKPLFFCSHCKRFDENPIHTNSSEIFNGLKGFIEHHCSCCNVTFLSSPEMIDYHSLSVEHLTLKCFDLLRASENVNSIQLIVSNKASQSEEDNKSPTIEITTKDDEPSTVHNELATDSIKLPMIILNKFKETSEYQGECKLCNLFIKWESKSILNHLLNCKYKYDLTGTNQTTIKKFICTACDYTIDHFHGYKGHIISHSHLTKFHGNGKYYSHICSICNIFMYSQRNDIISHWNQNHKDTTTTMAFSMLSTFMAAIFNGFNNNPNRVEMTHYYGDDACNGSKIVSQQCVTCKVNFHTSTYDYNMHEITSEHILLKFLTPKVINKLKNKLTAKCIDQTTIPTVIKDDSILPTNYTKDDEYDDLKYFQINENQSYVNCTALLEDIQNLQPFKEDVIRKESVSAMSVENYTPDNMSLPVNNQLDLYNTHLSEENVEYQYSNDNGYKINDVSECNNDPTLTPSLPLENMNSCRSYKTISHDKINHMSSKLSPTPHDSVNTLLVVPYDLNDEGKKKEKTKPLDKSPVSVHLNLNDMIQNLDENEKQQEIISNVESNHKLSSIFSKTTAALYHSLINITKHYENQMVDEYDIDKTYGEYVTQRLKHIKDQTVKHNIKLEIDHLFYTVLKK